MKLKRSGAFFAGAMALYFTISANAVPYPEFPDADTEERGHYFLSEPTPTEITEYAGNYFTAFTFEELSDLGFTAEEIGGLKLTPAITAYEYDKCDSRYYYFPVICNNEIIATLTVFEYDDGLYAAQFGKTKLAAGLNNLNGTADDPYAVIITEEGFFAVNSTEIMETLQIFYFDSETENISEYNLEIPDVTIDEMKAANARAVFTDDTTSYSETVDHIKSARSVSEKYLSVPHVGNTSDGVCWAASSASIIVFKTIWRPVAALRDELVSMTGSYNGFEPGTSENTAHLLNSYIPGASYDFYNDGWPSFTEIQSKINNEIPIYMNWQDYINSGHATVLRGITTICRCRPIFQPPKRFR